MVTLPPNPKNQRQHFRQPLKITHTSPSAVIQTGFFDHTTQTITMNSMLSVVGITSSFKVLSHSVEVLFSSIVFFCNCKVYAIFDTVKAIRL